MANIGPVPDINAYAHGEHPGSEDIFIATSDGGYMRRQWCPSTVPMGRGGNPSWIPDGSEFCLMCLKYTCHSHCENMSTHQQRQSMVEFIAAKKHAR